MDTCQYINTSPLLLSLFTSPFETWKKQTYPTETSISVSLQIFSFSAFTFRKTQILSIIKKIRKLFSVCEYSVYFSGIYFTLKSQIWNIYLKKNCLGDNLLLKLWYITFPLFLSLPTHPPFSLLYSWPCSSIIVITST